MSQLEPVTKTRARRIDPERLGVNRADLLIHALAQLPDNVTLELPNEVPGRTRMAVLARAYGIAERVCFGSSAWSADPTQTSSTMAGLIHAFSEAGDPPAAQRDNDGIFSGHRVAILTNVPAPYRLPLFSLMSQRLRRAGAEFRVFFMGTRARGRPWIGISGESDFDHESLNSREFPVGVRRPLFPLDLGRRLEAFHPTLVLVGSFSPLVANRAARYAQRHGAIFGIWSGEIARRSTSKSKIRQLQRRRLVRHSDFAIAYGFRAGEYLRGLRVDLPFVYGRNTSQAYGPERKRSEPRMVELLAVANMTTPGKGIEVLIDGLKAFPQLPCGLTVVGPGAERFGLEERAGGDERIRFVGALPQTKVQERYSVSDVFTFPSSVDCFGLAMVEAMGSGLAPVVSSTPGAVADLAVDGWNCLVVHNQTPEEWGSMLERVVSDHDLRRRLGENAAETIRRRWTMHHASDAMIAGLRLGLLIQEQRQRGAVDGS